MNKDRESLFGLNGGEQKNLMEQLQKSNIFSGGKDTRERPVRAAIPERFGRFSELPEYKQLIVQRVIADKMEISNPFFTCHDTKAKGRTVIDGKEFLNFSTYDYLGLNGHPEVNAAGIEAMQTFGTSAGASRLVAGERPAHRLLEKGIANAYGVEDAVVFVSGHATNVSAISTVLGPRDAIYHDALSHNSIILGAILSGATRYSYPHNDPVALEKLLEQTRSKHERIIIATEGLFSMDGSVATLPELIRLKQEYVGFLLMDEAHSFGILGKRGLGIAEHFGIPATEVDMWMGTLSKTLCGCGGFIAGCAEVVELLKFRAPGFVFSVGMPPPIAAASAKALEIMLREPERTQRIQEISVFFLEEAKKRRFNTGHAEGYAIIPVIVGNSLVAGLLSTVLFNRQINVMPIIYPVVEEGLARLRFFLSSEHTKKDIITTLDILAEELPKAVKRFA